MMSEKDSELEAFLKELLDQNHKMLLEGWAKIEKNSDQDDELVVPKNQSDNDKSFKAIRVRTNRITPFRHVETQKLYELRSVITFIKNSISDSKHPNSEFLFRFINAYPIPSISTSLIQKLVPFIDIGPENGILEHDNSILELLTNTKINYGRVIHDLLVIYTTVAIQTISNGLDVRNQFSGSQAVDVVVHNDHLSDIVFSVKYRKRSALVLKDFLYNSIEELRTYDLATSKQNQLVIINYCFEDISHEKVKDRFQNAIGQLVPEFADRITIVSISINNLTGLDRLLQEVITDYSARRNKLELLFGDAPRSISPNERFVINTEFLNSKTGTLAFWIKLPSIDTILAKPMNNQYVLGHDTNGGWPSRRSFIYSNAWGFGLHPNIYNTEKKGPPSLVTWRLWISNGVSEGLQLKTEPLDSNSIGWNHICIRWNHAQPILQILVNGSIVKEHKSYVKDWPTIFNPHATVGNWVNFEAIHNLNFPLYRFQYGPNYISDNLLAKESKLKISF